MKQKLQTSQPKNTIKNTENSKIFSQFQETAIEYTKLFSNSQALIQENHNQGQISMYEQGLKQLLQNKDLTFVQFPQLLQSLFDLQDQNQSPQNQVTKNTRKQIVENCQKSIKCSKKRQIPDHLKEMDPQLIGIQGRMAKKQEFNDLQYNSHYIKQNQYEHQNSGINSRPNQMQQYNNDNSHNFIESDQDQYFSIDNKLQNFNINDQIQQQEQQNREEDFKIKKQQQQNQNQQQNTTQDEQIITTQEQQTNPQQQQQKRKFYKLKGKFFKNKQQQSQQQQKQEQYQSQNYQYQIFNNNTNNNQHLQNIQEFNQNNNLDNDDNEDDEIYQY